MCMYPFVTMSLVTMPVASLLSSVYVPLLRVLSELLPVMVELYARVFSDKQKRFEKQIRTCFVNYKPSFSASANNSFSDWCVYSRVYLPHNIANTIKACMLKLI